jgi:hypothetical protein
MVEANGQFRDISHDGDKNESALDTVPFPVVIGNLYEELQTVIHGYGIDSIEATTKAREIRQKVVQYWSPRLQKVSIRPVYVVHGEPPEYTALTSTVNDTETTTCRMSFNKVGGRVVDPKLSISTAFHPDGFDIDGTSSIFTLSITPTQFSLSHASYVKREGEKAQKEKDGYAFEFH